jgi:2-dehydro-3-deoxy-D-arabinonate dehydratase
MPVQVGELPTKPCLIRVDHAGRARVALWTEGRLQQLSLGLDDMLRLTATEMRGALEQTVGDLELEQCELLAPVESQEVWACGVTYARSRAARMEESTTQDIYARVYQAERPELFFKSAGWRVVGQSGGAGVRPDSTWNVPEPELAVLSNSRGEVVAYACANDMSSRSIEGENPLYLPQAKVYDRSCSIGPAAVLAAGVDPSRARVTMQITRGGRLVFDGTSNVSEMVRDPAELSAVLHAAYPLPVGAWLLTGTSLVPPPPYTAESGDVIVIEIDGIGRLVNHVVVVPHSGARALPRLAEPDARR